MSTFMANKGNIERKWYILDAAGKPLGKTATVAATLLRGKHKPEYTPHADCGDFVIVINAEKAVLTGKKLDQKYYRTHSGYVGGLKETKYRKLMQDKPELAMKLAVRGMMPRNIITKDSLTRLKIFRGPEHIHAAQKPELWAAEYGGVSPCIRARSLTITAPAAGSPPWPGCICSPTALVPSPSTAVTSTTTSAWRP